MTDDIDDFIKKFQGEMLNQTRATYGEVFSRRWQNPTYAGVMEDADAVSVLKGTCGDTMVIFLKFANGRVEKASYQTDGCAPSIVCGSFAAELSVGKTPEELLDIREETIIEQIGALPEEVRHCAFLAAATVHSAVDEYMKKQLRGVKKEAGKK